MQGRHTSWLIAGSVLLFGLLGALPFHNDPPGAAATQAEQQLADGLVWQDPRTGAALAASELEHLLGAATAAQRADEAIEPVTALTALVPAAKEPPVMSEEYGALLRSYERQHGGALSAARTPTPIPHAAAKSSATGKDVRRARSPQRARPEPLATTATAPASVAPRQFAPPIVRTLPRDDTPPPAAPVEVARRVPAEVPPAEYEQHKVRDGDTLASIAERYLGDAGRGQEIFAANRDVLSDPELLPIGRRLRIPPRFAAPPAEHSLPPLSTESAPARPTTGGLSWEMRRLPAVQPVSTPAADGFQPRTRLAPIGSQ